MQVRTGISLYHLYSNQSHADLIAAPDNASEVEAGRATPTASALFDERGESFPETITLKSSTYSSFTTLSCHGGWEIMYPTWG